MKKIIINASLDIYQSNLERLFKIVDLAFKAGQEEERKRIGKEYIYKLKNAKNKLKQPLTLALLKQILFEFKKNLK